MKTAREKSKEGPTHPAGTETVASYALAPPPPARMPEALRSFFVQGEQERPPSAPTATLTTDVSVPP